MQQYREFPYFLLNEAVPFDEDLYHEFKGHRSISVEEIPPNCLRPRSPPKDEKSGDINFPRRLFHSRQSRQCVSKTLNAFLNTGEGGTVFLGITDDGIVRGIKLTQLQMDHICLSVHDLMSRYKPMVPLNMFKIRFTPVVEDHSEMLGKKDELQQTLNNYQLPNKRLGTHLLRTHQMCWCDRDAEGKMANGITLPMFIVEIRIFKWERPPVDYEMLRVKYHSYFHPIYETEEGDCYFRRQASVNVYTKQQIYDLTIQEVRDFCEEAIERLQTELKELQRKKAGSGGALMGSLNGF